MTLTEEQKLQVERNRLEALRRRQLAQAKTQRTFATQPTFATPSPPNLSHVPTFPTPSIPPATRQLIPYGMPSRPSQPAPQAPRTARGPVQEPKSAQFQQGAQRYPNCSDFPKVQSTIISTIPNPPIVVKKLPAQAVIVNKNRFEIHATFYQPLIDVIKTFPSKSYDRETRNWSLGLTDYKSFESKVKKDLSTTVTWEGLPLFVLDAIFPRNPPSTAEVQLEGKIPDKLKKALLSYQVQGVEYAIRRNGKILLADDMGLGKTIQAIAVAIYFKDFPVLCLAPSSVRFEWKEQWLRFVQFLLIISWISFIILMFCVVSQIVTSTLDRHNRGRHSSPNHLFTRERFHS